MVRPVRDPPSPAVAARWEALVAEVPAAGSATYGNPEGARRAFGATSLKIDGRIFAMLVRDRLVVKLPAARVGELVSDGVGERFDPGHGRLQKEWLLVRGEDPSEWRALTAEAEDYVGKRPR
jgi:hypothetical protein